MVGAYPGGRHRVAVHERHPSVVRRREPHRQLLQAAEPSVLPVFRDRPLELLDVLAMATALRPEGERALRVEGGLRRHHLPCDDEVDRHPGASGDEATKPEVVALLIERSVTDQRREVLKEARLAAALGRLPRDERRHGDVDRANPCRGAHVCVGALSKPAKPAREASALGDERRLRHVINGPVRGRWIERIEFHRRRRCRVQVSVDQQ